MANYDSIKKEGIVIHKTEVKDADSMIQCLGEDGRFSFYARGVRKATSKNAPSLNELTLGEFTLLCRDAAGNYLLKEAAAKRNYMKDGDFLAIAVENFLCELTSRVYSEEEGEGKGFYLYLKEGLEAIYDGFDPLTVGFILFCVSLRLTGFGLEVDGCVRCGSKTNIVGMNFPDGGYICENCFGEEGDERLEAYSLKALRYGFRCKPSDLRRVQLEKASVASLFQSLETYFFEGMGYHLKTLQFLLSYGI